MTEFKVTATFNTSPQELYDTWLDGDLHSEMTGGEATGVAKVGADFTAWDGYISGTNLILHNASKIVQTWRTVEFGDGDSDSRIEINLKGDKKTCEFTLVHTNIPEGEADYEAGWTEHYFEPMTDYFG